MRGDTDLVSGHVGVFAQLLVDRAGDGARSSSAEATLLTLLHHGPMSLVELARILGVREPTAHRLVTNLVAAELVTRTRAANRVALGLTRRGRTLARRRQAQRIAAVSDLLSCLEPAERAELDRLVSRVVAAATGDRAAARMMCRHCDHGRCTGAACPVGSAATAIELAAAARPTPKGTTP